MVCSEDICKKYGSLQSFSFEFISKVKDPAALFLFPSSAPDVWEIKEQAAWAGKMMNAKEWLPPEENQN